MAKKKSQQPPGGPAVRQWAALQNFLEELQSPEEHVRAVAVRQLCPCRIAWDVPVRVSLFL